MAGPVKKAETSTDTGLSSPDIMKRYGEFRKLLLERRNELMRHSDAERAELSAQVPTSPGDVGDASVLDTSADYFMKLADNDRKELLEIREAFARMQRGTYGICEACESDIAVERLERLPHARRCIDCQSLLESKRRAAQPQHLPKL